MKSLLVLLTVGAPLFAGAQVATSPVPAAGASPAASSTPTPARPAASSAAVSPAAGNTHDAANNVPLPLPAAGQPTGPILEKNIPLIPENAPAHTASGRHKAGAHPGSSPHEFTTFTTEQDLRTRIQLRQVQTQVMNDPALQEEWGVAHRAPTDPERRALLAAFYNHLFDRMIKISPSLADKINDRRTSAIGRMKYTRLGDPDNSDNPFVEATPLPSGPNPPVTDSKP